MLFTKLAEYLQKLEGTASRNEMTVILAELFKESSPDDARLIAYLSAGRLGPAYNSPDFGIADMSMLKALGSESKTIFNKLGDLGLVIEQIKSKTQNSKIQRNSNIKIQNVYDRLWKIAEVSGIGSQERKQELIRKLLDELDPVSAKYVVKIILGKLRTGFSDMTVLDSLSWMMAGDKSLRKNIENIYNVRADLGEVAMLVKDSKTLNFKNSNIGPEIGTPVLMAKAERASNSAEIWERNGECAVEYKLDGLRIQAHISKSQILNSNIQINSKLQNSNIKLFSRGLENVGHMYPDICAGLAEQVKEDCIVEGEMIAVDKNGKVLAFNKTMNRKRKYGIEDKILEIPMKIFLFDVLWLKNKSLINLPNNKRWECLEKLVKKGEIVELMPRIIAKSTNEIDEFFQKSLKEGMEGIVAKRLDAPYTPGNRDFSWIKMKTTLDSVDVVVMGYSVGEGKRTGFGIGEFLVGVYEPKSDKFLTVSKVGSGATDAEWVKLRKELEKLKVDKKPERYDVAKQYEQNFWVRPQLVLEIVANEISVSPGHTSGYGLRFPRLISWREKKPEDATTVSEIKSMYTSIRMAGEN
ncbi:MAG: putative DNA ligase [Candidatus Amesbacteria bacterium GW2011_GWA2_42_12]|uniref:DNA ligase (ATP) n=1 Tax=Candidatus Amesbacteria bacterium GW2011_GWA2_42_12 TaxID=1618356 RepID=A0A0G1B607_9BACT|nr:MAG: putative DNA ligase [Candidatus Amesbacteria bacterium GW2011_GWA2_42_12]